MVEEPSGEAAAGELPEPVQRYFRFAGVRASAIVSAVQIDQEGELLLGKSWKPFHATQYVDPTGPSFVWKASVRLIPGLRISVEDRYADGRGRIAAAVGFVPLMRREDGDHLAAGELHRYLAEAVWNPAALLPRLGVTWTPIDGNSARATLSAHGITVSLDCTFDSAGHLLKAFTPARFRDVKGVPVPTPWSCEYRDYIRLNRHMVPGEGEVSWLLPEGSQSYCRLRVTGIRNLTVWDAGAVDPLRQRAMSPLAR